MQRLRNGFTSVSCMRLFPCFDLIKCFSIDYMHNSLEGVLKKNLTLWYDSKYHTMDFHLPQVKQTAIDKCLLIIKPPNSISWKPRSLIQHRQQYNATEFKNLLLYYLFPIAKGIQKAKYVNHINLLSSSIYKLTGQSVRRNDIDNISRDLLQFEKEFEILYGPQNVTMNINLIRHVAEAVKQLGPLWTQSVFGFEANNGELVRKINANTDIL